MIMAYDKQEWRNDDPETPMSAARFTHMEDGIGEAHDLADAARSTADNAAPSDHTHDLGDVDGLESALSGKANSSSLSGKADKADVDALVSRIEQLESDVAALKEAPDTEG